MLSRKQEKPKRVVAGAPQIVKRRKWERFSESQNKAVQKGKPAKQSNAVRRQTPEGDDKLTFSDIFHKLFDINFSHDKRIFFAFLALLLIGVISVYSSSIVFAYRLTGNMYYFLLNHLKFIGIGFAAMSLFYFIRLEVISKLWFIPLFTSIFLLFYLLVLAKLGKAEAIDGATRWLELGSFQFQPSDFAKLSFVIFVSAFLSNKKTHYMDFQEYLKNNLLPYAFWFFSILGLILAGKNLGTAMVVGFIGITCYGVSSVTKYHKVGLAAMLVIMAAGGVLFGVVESYRADRINVWMNYLKTNDTQLADENGKLSRDKKSYQFDQVLTALGSGGTAGVGLGQSIGKFYFVKTTAGDDSIIGIIGEELGFYLTSAIILLYIYLIYRCITIANMFTDRPIYFYIMFGACSWIGFQMFVHVGANIGIVPLTGQTLPFISLGGSSLISLMCAMGLILNVSKQKPLTEEEKERLQQGISSPRKMPKRHLLK